MNINQLKKEVNKIVFDLVKDNNYNPPENFSVETLDSEFTKNSVIEVLRYHDNDHDHLFYHVTWTKFGMHLHTYNVDYENNENPDSSILFLD
jgi:hypothetical protein